MSEREEINEPMDEQEKQGGHLSRTDRVKVRERVRRHRKNRAEQEKLRLRSVTAEQCWTYQLTFLSDIDRQALQDRKAEYEQAWKALVDVLMGLDSGDAYLSDVQIVMDHIEKYRPAIRLSKQEVALVHHNPDVTKEQAEKLKTLFTELDPDWITFGVVSRFSKELADDFKDKVARFLIDNPDEEINSLSLAQTLQREFLTSWHRQFEQASEQAANPTKHFRLPPTEAQIVHNQAAREYSRTLQLQLESLKSVHPVWGKQQFPER